MRAGSNDERRKPCRGLMHEITVERGDRGMVGTDDGLTPFNQPACLAPCSGAFNTMAWPDDDDERQDEANTTTKR